MHSGVSGILALRIFIRATTTPTTRGGALPAADPTSQPLPGWAADARHLTGFPCLLDRLNPCAAHMEPFPSRLQSSHLNICQTTTDHDNPDGFPAFRVSCGSHASSIEAWLPPPILPVIGSLCAHPFSGLVDSAVFAPIPKSHERFVRQIPGMASTRASSGFPPPGIVSPSFVPTGHAPRSGQFLLGHRDDVIRWRIIRRLCRLTQAGRARSEGGIARRPAYLIGGDAAPIRFPSPANFMHFDSLFKVLIFSLAPLTNLPPLFGCIPKQPDFRRQRHKGDRSGNNGLVASLAPHSMGLASVRPRDASDYTNGGEAADSHTGLFPFAAATRGILLVFPPDLVASQQGLRHTEAITGGQQGTGRTRRWTPRQVYPFDLVASCNLCSKTHGSLDSAIHTKHVIATLHRREPRYPLPRVAVSYRVRRSDAIHAKPFLLWHRSQKEWLFGCSRLTASSPDAEPAGRWVANARARDSCRPRPYRHRTAACFAGRASVESHDPSGGSPTETFVRGLLANAGGRTANAAAIQHFTDHSIGRERRACTKGGRSQRRADDDPLTREFL
ncbi:hypothetical protein H6P81_021722 [Aristolochia fimbriata]|uniref:Uncharacterized protein n=1 Tax=Aristolochia fimbriata TaxID=158543 RepID=A0AAV7DP59_ARIFI|nr:hypothetical protein H6P81_021722 [Aristolochia fimbriata]